VGAWAAAVACILRDDECGMPACGQAVRCGVCDTPELWRGAAGLCARVCACAGAAESLHTYTYIELLECVIGVKFPLRKRYGYGNVWLGRRRGPVASRANHSSGRVDCCCSLLACIAWRGEIPSNGDVLVKCQWRERECYGNIWLGDLEEERVVSRGTTRVSSGRVWAAAAVRIAWCVVCKIRV